MAPTYFADAWYFIALVEPRDTHHREAVRLHRLVEKAILITHEGILTETLTYFSDDGPRARALAAQAVRRVMVRLPVISITRSLFTRALELYERRPDKEYSHVDCLSMIVMRDHGITHVLTKDHHFRQEGFTVLTDAQ